MPADPTGDALHLASASFHKCDFLVTWNCQHLANANKFGHIRRVNTLLGLFVPALVTPWSYSESTMNPIMPPDPAIDEIREVRHRISTSFDHDPAKLVAYLMEYQEQFRDRLIYDPSVRSAAQLVVQPDADNATGSRPSAPIAESQHTLPGLQGLKPS